MSDLISRKAAIDAICKACSIDDDYVKCVERRPESTFCDEIVALRKVPSVQPEHGRWIDQYGDGDWHCTSCGAIVEKHEQDYRNWHFCYHCGAKMD